MDIDSTMSLIFLGLLLAFIAGGALMRRHINLRETLRGGLSWVVLLVLLMAGYGMWDDMRRSDANSMRMQIDEDAGRVEIPKSRDGHFYVALAINGGSVQMMADPGASERVLSPRDARRTGLDPDALAFTGRAQTANGSVRIAPVFLDEVRLGPVTDQGIRAWVNEADMDLSLLGMNYLQRWSRMEITRDALILTR